MARNKVLISWFGGKTAFSRELIPLFPKHDVFVDVFGGSGAVIINKPPSKLEVYNDIDGDLVNLFRVIRDPETFEEFYRKVSLTLYSEQEFREARELLGVGVLDGVDRAVATYVKFRMSFSGIGTSWSRTKSVSRRGMSIRVSAWLRGIEDLVDLHDTIRRFQVENRDFREILKMYDSEAAFFYLDPPYVPDTRVSKSVYGFEMSEKDHVDLVDILLGIKGKALLSGYDNDVYRQLESDGWWRKDFVRHTTVRNDTGKRRSKRVEVVWANYELPEDDYGVL